MVVTTIEIDGLTKRFGSVLAVDDLKFGVPDGAVTGLLGPNGAGKTTTLRMLLGLVSPTTGTAMIGGVPYARLSEPVRTVGAVLEASSFHPARTARDHLRVVASAARIPTSRVDEMLEQVGLAADATRRVGGYSLGMRQRLGLATALLGDPRVLVLDEPTNGLDPAGVRWLRDLIRDLSREGRTILVSSHLLAEVAQSVDHVVIIDRGRLVTAAPLADLTSAAQPGVMVRTPDTTRLRAALTAAGIPVDDNSPDRIVARGATPEAVGRAVAVTGVVVYEMSLVGGSLEDAFLRLTTPEEITR
jgi:ABC-2 type transport system ATP-binding protein